MSRPKECSLAKKMLQMTAYIVLLQQRLQFCFQWTKCAPNISIKQQRGVTLRLIFYFFMKRSLDLAVIAIKTSNTKRFFLKVHFTHGRSKTSDRKQYDRIKIAERRSRKEDKTREEREGEGWILDESARWAEKRRTMISERGRGREIDGRRQEKERERERG